MAGRFKNLCGILSCSAIEFRSFICEKCRSIRSRCSLFFFFFFLFMQVVCDYLKKKERNVITRGNSDMTRDELHLEPSALRIDDRDRTSRHRSAQ